MALMSIASLVSGWALKKPATRLYPFEKRTTYEKTRGHIEIDINACILCGICQKKCPTQAIVVDKPAKSWEIERLRCITCNACVDACPKKCLFMRNTYSPACSTNSQKELFIQPPKAETPAPAA